MAQNFDKLNLDVLETDPVTPPAGQLWYSTADGLGPRATQAVAGAMCKEDKLKLDNMSANGSGDDWCTGLLVEAQPSPDQTVKYAAGTYMVNGVLYSIAAPGNYNLQNGYGGVNHYTALSADQRALVLIYVDAAQVIKSVAGAASSGVTPPMPTIPNDVVCLAFVLIAKAHNGAVKNITPSNLTDVRVARRALYDEAAKVRANDTTSGFLRDKLTDNGNVHFTVENPDAAETLKADVQFGTSSTTACVGNDSRLSDGRTDSNALHKATSAEISAMTEKVTPVAADVIVIEDSAASFAKKKVQLGSFPTGTDVNAIHKATSGEISAMTEKTTPVSADLLVIEDSAATNAKKKIQIGNLPAGSAPGSAGDMPYKATSGGGFAAEAQGPKWDETKHAMTIGPNGASLSNNPFSSNGNVNSWVQSNVQNLSNGATASSDLVATMDNGNDNSGYTDFGINGSGNTDSSWGTFSNPGDGYLYCCGGSLAIGTDTAKDLFFFTGGTLDANVRARLTALGSLVMGTAALATNATAGFIYVAGSAGVPVGTPTAFTGRVPITVDTTNNRVYFYTNGAWRVVGDESQSNKGQASGYASLNASTKVVENPANATATATANKIPIADANGKLDSWITGGGTSNAQKTESFPITQGTYMQWQTSAGAYERVRPHIFRGSNVMGTPSAIKVLAWVDSGCTCAIRVQDITNNKTICSNESITGTSEAIGSLGAISNVPTGEALWEVQIYRKVGSGGSKVYCSLWEIQY